MQIIHKIDAFLYTIFPELSEHSKGNDLIISKLKEYYTYGPYQPNVRIEGDWVIIEIDIPSIESQEADYQKVVSLSEQGNFSEAKSILSKLINQNPSVSEYHRIMGQILSEEGNQEEAINYLIDSLRWDSKNNWALLMMGNIFARFKDDIPTAMKYYDQALVANPNDNITINNIGANLMQQGKLEEAKIYFDKAIQIDNQYPNTYFALAMIAEMEGDLEAAFDRLIQSIKVNKNNEPLLQSSIEQAIDIAQKILQLNSDKHLYESYKAKLESEGNKKVDIVIDEEISTAAKLEFAENYDREVHVIRYKSNYPAVEHLIMHELAHLDLVIQARKENLNQLFVSNEKHKKEFFKSLDSLVKRLETIGIPEKSISDFCTSLFNGLNSQVYNAPIDLFIEDFLYKEFPELRAYQFLSLFTILQEGLQAVTDKKIIDLYPKHIVSKSKVYNLVSAFQFKELYGIDFIGKFNSSPSELRQAKDFYEEFLEYKVDKEPGEEYELILNWAKDLGLSENFELVLETEFRNKPTPIDAFLSELGIESEPQKTSEDAEVNMAVVMFMLDALKYFENMSKDEIRNIAFDIAVQGEYGYHPEKDGYKLKSIKDKEFSGYHILAYYYVSWALAIPDMLSQLQLPFDKEYNLAQSMFK